MNEYIDIGPERPTQPAEPGVTDAELDALRHQWRKDVLANLDPCWLGEASVLNKHVANTVLVIATHVIHGDLDDACAMAAEIVEAEVEKREREHFSG